ncbi:MAG: 16S rRNA (adenine(1518)-N(6)/adenine(1519)-N(6))-dimethyltransferase RsmA [Syntrophomonadales bacterium]
MDNATLSGVRSLLAAEDLRPHKGLGQNFLVDKNILQKIVKAGQIAPHDVVLEIGTGLGALTLYLAEAAGRVVTVEIDKKLIPILQKIFVSRPKITLMTGDILALDWERELYGFLNSPLDRFVICANLPYYITSPIIFRILENKHRVKQAVLMVQREVADRLLATPGTKEYSLLTVMVSRMAGVELVTRVSRNCFYPSPEVDSTVIKLVPHYQPQVEVEKEEVFTALVRAAFQARRKTMLNVLVNSGFADRDTALNTLESLGVDPRRRGETLSVEEFAQIANRLS